ncbi:hypothetical protein [Epibacterium sp. Ofav1-8]|uniref:hypothetical protein n=1 Tax=Epibacterium sp. Ofav1-8 TaxID=2917735 RepID=UPI001EF5D360|nr:hypothetical protein [Epibacterium sp. Ofav1-8]MCG7624722.1 hypothetical protein [Epibacterium sp. Ofav1-8]
MMSVLRRLPRRALLAATALIPVGLLGIWGFTSAQPAPQDLPALEAPEAPLRVYHLGHSLVGQNIPHLLAQFAGEGHRYNMQRGSGTSLRAHWEDSEPILDFDAVNKAPVWRDPKEALAAGEYDAVILTEMVELRDALDYFDGAKYLHRWASLARSANPDVRLYLYETWHRLDDPVGWLERIDSDLDTLWLGRLTATDTRSRPETAPIYLIPGGQVLAAVVRAAEAGQIPGLDQRAQLFARAADGSLDQIHLSPLGEYIIALTHYAVLYHRSPEGLPHQVTLFDGTAVSALDAEGAARVQALVWEVVTRLPRTGVQPAVAVPPAEDPET